MAKKIKLKLLWESICWVYYQYALRTPEEQRARQLRAYQHEDGARAAHTIKVLRHAYHCQMRAFETGMRRSRPDFEITKDMVIESLKLEHDWSPETRNVHSSIASTYITWDRNGQSDISKRKLALVVAYGNMFLRPNCQILHGKQGVLI